MTVYGPSFHVRFHYDPMLWPDQVERACQVLESEFQNNPVICAIVFVLGSRALPLPDRMAFLRKRAKTKLRQFTLTNHSRALRRPCYRASVLRTNEPRRHDGSRRPLRFGVMMPPIRYFRRTSERSKVFAQSSQKAHVSVYA